LIVCKPHCVTINFVYIITNYIGSTVQKLTFCITQYLPNVSKPQIVGVSFLLGLQDPIRINFVYELPKVKLLDERYSTIKMCSGALLLFLTSISTRTRRRGHNLIMGGDISYLSLIFPNYEKPVEEFRVTSTDEDT
jgi:hypothetical protein